MGYERVPMQVIIDDIVERSESLERDIVKLKDFQCRLLDALRGQHE